MVRGTLYRQLEKMAEELEELLDEIGELEKDATIPAEEVEELIEGIYNKITKLMAHEI